MKKDWAQEVRDWNKEVEKKEKKKVNKKIMSKKEKVKNCLINFKENITQKFKKIKEKVWFWFYFDSFIIKIYDAIFSFVEWIIKCVQYSIFLWKDCDWDYSYFIQLMQYKAKRMRKCIKKNNHLESNEQVVNEIQKFEDIIEDWINKDFVASEQAAHEKKWGEIIQDIGKETTVLKNGLKLYRWNPKRKNATTKKLHNQERKEQMKIYDLDNDRQMKQFNLIFDYLKEHLLRWWD